MKVEKMSIDEDFMLGKTDKPLFELAQNETDRTDILEIKCPYDSIKHSKNRDLAVKHLDTLFFLQRSKFEANERAMQLLKELREFVEKPIN